MTPLLLFCSLSFTAPLSGAAFQPVSLSAIRTPQPPKIDGQLNDACWSNVSAVSGFITNIPQFGEPARERTEVKMVYDDHALYIGAYLYDSEPEKIARQLGERDSNANADWFSVGLDTYDDNLNGYRFQLSSVNVQTDMRLSQGNNDPTWDAVWFSKTSLQADGWVAEIKIPYSAIRFSRQEVQQWGLQFARYVLRQNELSAWSPVNPNVDGIVNQWGTMRDLKKLKPPLRLALIPYFTAGFVHEPVSLQPKEMAWRRILGGGMDVKWGIDESFTLDMTLVPDFGQVQSDNLTLNLGPFEQTFEERRPFFTEGTELFRKQIGLASGQLFYSRRIGATPSLFYDVPYLMGENYKVLSNPAQTQLYNATKISGRTRSGLGIGVLNAVAAPMYARVQNLNDQTVEEILTEPLTNYNMVVLDQSLPHNSRIGLVNTNVYRKGNGREANVTSFNFNVRDKTNTYTALGYVNLSQIYDPLVSKRPSIGYRYYAGISKISGRFQFDVFNTTMSRNYDQNDMGVLFHANEITNFVGLKYLDYEPKGQLNNWSTSLGLVHATLYDPLKYQHFEMNCDANFTFKNFWSTGLFVNARPFWYYDYYEPRVEGMKFHHAPYVYANWYASTDFRKNIQLEANIGFGESPIKNDPYLEFSLSPIFRIANRAQINYTLHMNTDFGNFGFVNFDENGDVVMGRRKLYTISQTLNVSCAINARMNITLRTRYYWSKARYDYYYSLDEYGNLWQREYNGNGHRSFNVWNVDFVYNWQFAPGSNLIITYKNNILQSNREGDSNYWVNAKKTFDTPALNSVALKVIYYLDYLQVKELADKRKAKTALG